jgi:hypothetical protein
MECGLFLSFFRFLCFLAGKLSREEPEGVESVVRVAGWTIWGVSVLSFFSSRSAMFRQSLVDTRLPALLAVVLRFCRCLLRPESSLLPGTWSSRARGFVTPWAACDDHVSTPVAVLDGVRWIWVRLLQGICRRRLRRCIVPTTALFWVSSCSWLQIVFDRLLGVRFSLVFAF